MNPPISEAKVIVTWVPQKDAPGFDAKSVYFRGQVLGNDGVPTTRYISIRARTDLLGAVPRVLKGQIWHAKGGYSTRQHEYGTTEIITARHLSLELPSGENFVRAVAENSAFKGIGEVLATRIWQALGPQVYERIDADDADGIIARVGIKPGSAACETIRRFVQTWKQQKMPSEVLAWLDLAGVGHRIGQRLLRHYGADTLSKLTEDPYRVSAFGVRWEDADRLARESLGVAPDDPKRLQGALRDTVFSAYAANGGVSGNTVVSRNEVEEGVRARLGGDDILTQKALGLEKQTKGIVSTDGWFAAVGVRVMERYISKRLRHALDGYHGPPPRARETVSTALKSYLTKPGAVPLTGEQREAVVLGLAAPVGAITGGAGTGKTTVLKALHHVVKYAGGQVYQMALAGRAARRMEEATGHRAYTIAAILFHVEKGSLSFDQHGKRVIPYIVIDESSMLDLPLVYRLIRKLPSHARILFVGDPAQLPPIGPGLIFHRIATSKSVPRVELTKVHRQAEETGIPAIAAEIRKGVWPSLETFAGQGKGVSFVEANNDTMCDVIEDLYGKLGGPCTEDGSASPETQILCSVVSAERWKAGTGALNALLQECYTIGNDPVLIRHEETGALVYSGFRQDDPIMFTQNDARRNVYNGSIGRITEAYRTPREVADINGKVDTYVGEGLFDCGVVLLTESDVRERLLHAYAITVHKAQGSQFRRVIIPIVQTPLLDRTLLYTAVTRAQEQVVFVGETRVAKEAVLKLNSERLVAFSV